MDSMAAHREGSFSMMTIPVQAAALIILVGFLAGCGWVPQKVTISPQAIAPASNVGDGATVTVTVTDTRPTLRIGYRGLDSKLAEISTDQDLAMIFQQKIVQGLTQQGFKVVAYGEAPGRVLKVEIRALEYTSDLDFWKGTVRTKAAIQAYSKRDDVAYDKLYVAERQQAVVDAPRAKTNEKMINGAISDVLQRLFEDSKLMKVLAN